MVGYTCSWRWNGKDNKETWDRDGDWTGYYVKIEGKWVRYL
ncbi:MAG: hypothetical protein ACT4RN_24175 [Pseudonocardia sp.]